MAIRQYIGARYVPKFVGIWDVNTVYEPLSIVTYMNNSYTSKSEVPAGIVPTDTTYWVETGNYNGQIANLEKEIQEHIYINVMNPPSGCPTLDNTNTQDNTSDLQQIINYIYASNFIGATIYFPKGTYKFNGTVDVNTNHVRLLGEEKGATTFRCDTTVAGGLDMFYIHARFISFENIAFWVIGDNTYENTFIHSVTTSRSIFISNCMFYDAKFALIFDDTPGLRCQNVWVAFNSITYTNPIAWNLKGKCNSSYLLNCVGSMVGNSGTAIKLEDRPQDIYIEHFESSRGTYGLEITSNGVDTCNDLQIIDSVFDEPSLYGIYIHDLNSESEISIIGGCITPRSNGGKGMRIQNCENIKIEGVKFLNTSSHNLTNVDGISITGTTGNILVTGCYFYDMIRAVIALPGGTNSYKNLSCNNNMVVNQNHTGGTLYMTLTTTGSISNNSFSGDITEAIHADSGCSNIMIIGNNGLTNSTVTNNYLGAYAPTGFEPTLTNVFTT